MFLNIRSKIFEFLPEFDKSDVHKFSLRSLENCPSSVLWMPLFSKTTLSVVMIMQIISVAMAHAPENPTVKKIIIKETENSILVYRINKGTPFIEKVIR